MNRIRAPLGRGEELFGTAACKCLKQDGQDEQDEQDKRASRMWLRGFSGRPRLACLKQDGQDVQDGQDGQDERLKQDSQDVQDEQDKEEFSACPTSRLVLTVHVGPEKPLSAADGTLILAILFIMQILLQIPTPAAPDGALYPGHPDNPGHPASDTYTRRTRGLSYPGHPAHLGHPASDAGFTGYSEFAGEESLSDVARGFSGRPRLACLKQDLQDRQDEQDKRSSVRALPLRWC